MSIISLDNGVKQIRTIKDAEVLTPVAQATVDAWTDVALSVIDTACRNSVAIVCKNTHGVKSLNYKVLGSIDGTTYVEVQASVTLTYGTVGSYSTTNAVWRYYKVQVQSTGSGAGEVSQATVSIISK